MLTMGLEPIVVSVADLLADTPELAHIDDPFLGFSQVSFSTLT